MTMARVSRRSFIRKLGAASAAATLFTPRSAAARAAMGAEEQTTTATPAPGKMRFGVQTAPQHVTYNQVVDAWKEADELGFDSAFVFDHFMPIFSDPNGPCLEGWTLLSALATQTRRVKVGVLVTGNTYRFPAVLAKMAATVDHVSNGRLILGIGAAWHEQEHTAYGMPFHTVGGRARRLGESLEVLKLLFTRDKSNFTGKYYQLKDATFEPKTVQRPHPPILVGGVGPKLIQPLAARHANIWHFFVRDGGQEQAKQMVGSFDKLCRDLGRNPAEVEKSTSLRPPDLAGSSKEVRDRVQALADAGVRHLIVSLSAPYDREILRRFAKEVMPAFRQA